MSKNLLSLLTITFLFYNISVGQTYLVTQWDHTYGGFENEVMTTVKELHDKGFIVGGYTRSDTGANVSENTRGGTDFWIVNTDSNGVFRWDKRFGGSIEDRLFSIDLAFKGSLILGGYTTSDSSGDVSQPTRGSMDYWVVKTDSLGNKVWDRRFGGSQYDNFTSLARSSDGGILAGGYSLSDSGGDVSEPTRGGEDYWVVKMDSTGNKLWDKRYGGDLTDELFYIINTSDNGFLLGGWTNTDSAGDVTQHTKGFSDAWIVKINSTGTKQWDKRFGGAFGEGIVSMAQTSDGGYILYINTTSDSTGDVSHHTRDTSSQFMDRGDMWIVKIDSLGNKMWDKMYGGKLSDHGFSDIMPTKDKGYFFVGNSFSPIGGEKTEDNFGRSQSWAIKTDSTGGVIVDKTVYANSEDEGGFGFQMSGGCYLVANNSHSSIGGYKSEGNIGQNDYWLVKFCESEFPQLPVADFIVLDSAGLCEGACFTFQNNSLYSGNFVWSFPGGSPSTSTGANPGSICYSTPGNYDVTLIADNTSGGDTITIAGAVTVFGLPTFNIQQNGDTLSVPAGMTYYQWYLNDTMIYGDTLNYIIATREGDYNIIYIDSHSCPGFDTLMNVSLGMTALNGTFENINVWPNPVKNQMNLSYVGEIADLEILDLSGRVVFTANKFRQHSVDVSNFSPGVYFVKMNNGQKIFTKKIIVSH